MLLDGKNAVIYGAGGTLGGGVARTFAREGATVFLAGRTRETLQAVADGIIAQGGRAEVAVVDATDEQAVDAFVRSVVDKAGSVDVSFSLASRGDVQGVPLVDMTTADFTRATDTGLSANFITARAAARHMVGQGSGVILTLTSGSAWGAQPMMGSTGPACAATDVFGRYLAAEVGASGVRVVGLWTAGVDESLTKEKLEAVAGPGMDVDAIKQGLASMTMLKRTVKLADVTETAAFLASDRASGITGTIVNVTCGLVPA